MSGEYRPRISIDLTEEQKRRLDKHITWGNKKVVFSVVVDELIELCERHGAGIVIGAFISRQLKLKDICKLKLAEEG
jgi:hypothetical protein